MTSLQRNITLKRVDNISSRTGNARVVANQNGEVEQVNHYYPYGGLMGESTSSDHQPYKYNGKELDRHHGLDWFDYGARWDVLTNIFNQIMSHPTWNTTTDTYKKLMLEYKNKLLRE